MHQILSIFLGVGIKSLSCTDEPLMTGAITIVGITQLLNKNPIRVLYFFLLNTVCENDCVSSKEGSLFLFNSL